MGRRYDRTATLLITLFGGIVNSILTIQVFAAWRSFKWDQESEWEASGDKWQLNGIKIVWGLLFLYFASAASMCAVGLHGVLKSKPSHVRFYRDYSIADFSFCALFGFVATYGAFRGTTRAGVCEELSHHAELMRNVLEMGLNLENCELWLERAVVAVLGVGFVVMIIRLHFLLAVSNYYSHLVRHSYHHHARSSSCASAGPSCLSGSSTPMTSTSHSHHQHHPMQRIFLLPNTQHHPLSVPSVADADASANAADVEMVYAPVPKSSLPKEMQDRAMEAWVSSSSSSSSSTTAPGGRERHHRRHSRHHHHGHHGHGSRHRSSSTETTGRIKLDILPGEGLLPVYADDVKA